MSIEGKLQGKVASYCVGTELVTDGGLTQLACQP
jgi:hypothetical protein